MYSLNHGHPVLVSDWNVNPKLYIFNFRVFFGLIYLTEELGLTLLVVPLFLVFKILLFKGKVKNRIE